MDPFLSQEFMDIHNVPRHLQLIIAAIVKKFEEIDYRLKLIENKCDIYKLEDEDTSN